MLEVRTNQTDWMIDGDVLKKGFRYNNLIAIGSVHYSQIMFTKSQSEGQFDYSLDLVFSPSPWPDAPDCVALGQLFLNAKSTEHPRVKFSFSHQDGSAVLSTELIGDLGSFLHCLAQCRPMRLIIDYGLGKPLEIPFPNDIQFVTMAQRFFL